jgi:hypothetical protein
MDMYIQLSLQQQTMMPEQVLAILVDQSGHLASSPSPSALVDNSHQAKPSSFFFFFLLLFCLAQLLFT